MINTVDLVIMGGEPAATVAAVDAVGRGLRVLVVIRECGSLFPRRLRRAIGTARLSSHLLTVLTGAEVVCVDGVPSVEAVVVRQLRTGRLVAFNAAAVVAV